MKAMLLLEQPSEHVSYDSCQGSETHSWFVVDTG